MIIKQQNNKKQPWKIQNFFFLNFFVSINKNNSIGHKSFDIKDPATFSPKKIPENLSNVRRYMSGPSELTEPSHIIFK